MPQRRPCIPWRGYPAGRTQRRPRAYTGAGSPVHQGFLDYSNFSQHSQKMFLDALKNLLEYQQVGFLLILKQGYLTGRIYSARFTTYCSLRGVKTSAKNEILSQIRVK